MPIKFDPFELGNRLSNLSPGEWVILIIFFIFGGVVVNLLKKSQIDSLKEKTSALDSIIKQKESEIKSKEDELGKYRAGNDTRDIEKVNDNSLSRTGIIIYCNKPLAFSIIPRLQLKGTINQNSVTQEITKYLSWGKSTEIIPVEAQKRYVISIGYLTAYFDLFWGQAKKEVLLEEGEVKLYTYTPSSFNPGAGEITKNSN
jgi:hypothetical protein